MRKRRVGGRELQEEMNRWTRGSQTQCWSGCEMRGTERGCGSRGRINDGVVKIRMSGVRGERRYAGSIIKTQAALIYRLRF